MTAAALAAEFVEPLDGKEIPPGAPMNQYRQYLRPILGKRNRSDQPAVSVGLLSLEIQSTCQTSQQALVLAKQKRFEAAGTPESHTLR